MVPPEFRNSNKMNAVKYRYAEDSLGCIVDVETVDRECRGEYRCISCGEELVSVIGDKRRRHYRHKNISASCSEETYLHQIGKRLFYDTYRSCLDGNRDFHIVLAHPRVCDFCANAGPCCMPPVQRASSLTNYFTQVYLERADGNFVPDVLLLADSGKKAYIEIAVRHCVEREKRSSGVRLIEIRIEG